MSYEWYWRKGGDGEGRQRPTGVCFALIGLVCAFVMNGALPEVTYRVCYKVGRDNVVTKRVHVN